MGDDASNKLQQVLDIIGKENIPDNLKGLLSLLSTSNSQNKTEETTIRPIENDNIANVLTTPNQYTKDDNYKTKTEEPNDHSDSYKKSDPTNKLGRIFEKLRSNNDPRINLLIALKPFLGNHRQNKIGNCVKILQMASLMKFVEDTDSFNL